MKKSLVKYPDVNYPDFWKRVVDVVLAFFMLLVLFPVFLALFLGISIYLGGSPFFFQNRPGKGAKAFRIIKFKTMLDIRGQSGELLPDEKKG